MHKLSTKNTRVNKKYKKLTRNLPRGPSKQKKKRTRKRKQMKGGDVSPIKNIFYIWLGETDKCGLTQENLKSWRDGFPEARITILVIEEKITEFNKRFELILKEFGVIVVSPIAFLRTLPVNEPIQKTISLLETFLPFLMKGDESLFNESCKYVTPPVTPPDTPPPPEDFFNSVMENNYYFNKVHRYFTNTSVKIAARFKDLLCFIVCIYMKNTLYLDIDTTFKQFNPEKIPTSPSPKLFLPIILDRVDDKSKELYKTDLYAVLSLDSVDIDVSVVNNYVQIIADYLDAVPYYYLGFTTIGAKAGLELEPKRYNLGVQYLRDQFNMTSTVLLAFAHFIFQQQNDVDKSEELEKSNKYRLINENMMMLPNINNLEPHQMSFLHAYNKRKSGHVIHGSLVRSKEIYQAKCERIMNNIEQKKPSILHLVRVENDDIYEIVIFIYEFRKKINNKFLNYLIRSIKNIIEVKKVKKDEADEEDEEDEVNKKNKTNLTKLKDWICQMLDERYKDGFNDLFNLYDSYTFNDKDKVFPYLGKCQVTLQPGQVLCDNGIIDFHKKFNHSYFA